MCSRLRHSRVNLPILTVPLLALLAVSPLRAQEIQMPAGYQSNRNLADPGTPNPPQTTVEQLATLPAVTPEVADLAINEITVPPEFDVTVFATPPSVNDPTGIAAGPEGTLYVAVDGNGAQSFFPHMGRILRVRDLDGDGKADEVKAFVPDINSPRGLIWDHDHLIVMAPPNISAFYDHDGDGVADEQRILVRGVGYPLSVARVDHGQNGIEMGIDGWIYLAEGDQGILDATGSDGRKLHLHGGGVVRFRPDGSGLELWARGTRNIYGVAISPLLDAFARDNTNDGGGWNVRFHHFTGMEDHGYPSLFINFQDEIVQPLADFGGGSGTGATWIDEPGIPAEWNNAPFTTDYGRDGVYHQGITPNGATYTVTNDPFITVRSSMDVEVDSSSHIYVATWRNGAFSWNGPNAGMIYRVTPKNFTPAPMPDYDAIGASALVSELDSPSARRRLLAQRAILRRPEIKTAAAPLLLTMATDGNQGLANRVAALFTYRQLLGNASTTPISRLVSDPTIEAWALRALADDLTQAKGLPVELATGALKSADPRVRKEAIIALVRAGATGAAGAIATLMEDADPIVSHTAVQALRNLDATDVAFSLLDNAAASDAMRRGALQVLEVKHTDAVVNGLTARLTREADPDRQVELVAALARLAHEEAPWNGTWWTTHPANVGPYYDPVAWEDTDSISTAINSALAQAGPAETVAIGRELQRNGASAGAAVAKFIAFADSEPTLVPQITAYFARADQIPAEAIPVLQRVMTAEDSDATVRAQALAALARIDDQPSWSAMPAALQVLNSGGGAGGRGGRGGFGGFGAATPTIPNVTTTQTALVTAMEQAVATEASAVTAARTALTTSSLTLPANPGALQGRAEELADAELKAALARADYFTRIQDSVARFDTEQIAALAQQTAAGTANAGGGRGGFGGRGGRGGGGGNANLDLAREAILNSPKIDDYYRVFVDQAERLDGDVSVMADGVLLKLAARKFGAEAARQAAAQSLDTGWSNPRRKIQIMAAAVANRDLSRAMQIAAAVNDPDLAVAETARNAVQSLGIDPAQLRADAAAPRLAGMSVDTILNTVVNTKGSIARGQQLVSELGCTACHAVSSSEPPKGPFLGGIAGIMDRRQIAQAILQPNNTISQGFATYQIDLRDGSSLTGFVTSEGADAITVRDITSKETRIPVANIVRRTDLGRSLMPAGLVAGISMSDFASLLDYLQSLNSQ